MKTLVSQTENSIVTHHDVRGDGRIEVGCGVFLSRLNADVDYCFVDTRWGRVVVTAVDGVVCELRFVSDTDEAALSQLRSRYPLAEWHERDSLMTSNRLYRIVRGEESVRCLVEGSPFQKMVWRAVATVPYGGLLSYAAIARIIGHPQALRAVGTAVGKNPIALIIPCHRIVRSDGSIGGYAYGIEMKRRLLQEEKIFDQILAV